MPCWGPLPSLGSAFGLNPGPQSLSEQPSGMPVAVTTCCLAFPAWLLTKSPQPGLDMRVIYCPNNPLDMLCSSCLGTMGQGSCPRVSTGSVFLAEQPSICCTPTGLKMSKELRWTYKPLSLLRRYSPQGIVSAS